MVQYITSDEISYQHATVWELKQLCIYHTLADVAYNWNYGNKDFSSCSISSLSLSFSLSRKQCKDASGRNRETLLFQILTILLAFFFFCTFLRWRKWFVSRLRLTGTLCCALGKPKSELLWIKCSTRATISVRGESWSGLGTKEGAHSWYKRRQKMQCNAMKGISHNFKLKVGHIVSSFIFSASHIIYVWVKT